MSATMCWEFLWSATCTVQYVDITENRLLDRTLVTAQYDISDSIELLAEI